MKRIISIILCISLICSMSLSVSATQTENTASSWAEGYIDKAENLDIYDSSNSSITYKKYIDRESYCILAYNTLDKAGVLGETKVSGVEIVFNDTNNLQVNYLNKIGIIKGKGNNKFAPRDSLTREEAATILYRMLDFAGYFDKPHGSSDSKAYSSYALYGDDKQISDWAYDAVYAMLEAGIMNGTGFNFEPKNPYTGEQAITTMVRIMELISSVEPEISDENTFADNLNCQMPKDKNYMFSPLSIKMVLAMAANGASGETQSEILSTIGVKNLNSYNERVRSLIDKYNQLDILRLNVANSIWINKSSTDQNFSGTYSDTLKKYYDAKSDTVTNEDAVQKINGWVNDKTVGKIPGIISKDNIDFDAMLLNAVYFKAKWANVFSKNATKADTFTDRNGKESQIDFMNKTSWISYAKTDSVQIVKLPYERSMQVSGTEDDLFIRYETLEDVDVSMYLLMSDGSSYNPEDILKHSVFENTYVRLSVPKFKIEYSTGLNGMLGKLGINKAFTNSAEFQNMFDQGNMAITDTIHKTYITVDEEGTEAAAVTGMMMAGTAIPPEPITVKYNKPFTFVIMDNANDEILFMGEYAFAE